MKTNLTQNEDGDENIITETKNELTKNTCENITLNEMLVRNCPMCQKLMIYKDEWYYNNSKIKNRKCRSCSKKGKMVWNKGRKSTEDEKKKLSEILRQNPYWLGKKLSEETKEKIRNSKIGGKMSEETKRKISKANTGNQYRKGIPHDEKSKIKMRAAAVNKIKQLKGIICPNYNEISCDYFQKLNMWTGWNGYYAKNKGEFYLKDLGYWPDYYEPNENIIIEWDEPKHYKNGCLSKLDIIRMERIKNHLKCRFFRVDSKTNEIKEF